MTSDSSGPTGRRPVAGRQQPEPVDDAVTAREYPVNSGPELGSSSIEDDPTGMRDLLSSLPDPGPMPPELSERILAALQQERRSPQSIWDAEPAPEVPGIPPGPGASVAPPVADLVAHRRRRSVGPWLAAAAVLGVVALGGSTLLRNFTEGNSTAAGSNASARHSSDGAASEAAPSSASTTESSASSTASVAVLSAHTRYGAARSGAAVTADTVVDRARQLRDDTPVRDSATADTTAVAACLQSLNIVAGQWVRVDQVSYAGDPATLIVLAREDGQEQALVVTPECGAGAADPVLLGPVALS